MKKKISIYLFSLLLFFIILEVIINFFNFRPKYNNFGWKDAHDTYKKYIIEIEKNEFGTRDIPYNKRPKGKQNIILLGDSQIELSQAAENMPARILENELKNFYNVYSFGSWGWGNDQQLLILNKTIKQIKPKFVILFFTPNDLENNLNNIGFKGEKPTYKIDDQLNIEGPGFLKLKYLLNQLWTYRVIYRIKLMYKKKNYKNFIEDNSFSKRSACKNHKTINQIELFDHYSDYNYLRNKHIANLSARGEKIKDEIDFKKDIKKNLILRNRYKPLDDKFYYFRDIQSLEDKKQIKLTNYLLNNIQKVSIENDAKFILLNVVNENNLFQNDNIYKVCINNKLVKYSNIYFDKFFSKVFKDIEMILNHKILKGTKEYDLIDGHLNLLENTKIFSKLAKKIKKLETK